MHRNGWAYFLFDLIAARAVVEYVEMLSWQ